MTPAELKSIEERYAGATKEHLVRYRYSHGGGRMTREQPTDQGLVIDAYNEGDREFYFSAVDDVAALLAEVERLREQLDAVAVRADAAETECVRLLRERTDVSLRAEVNRLREQRDEARALVRHAGHAITSLWSAEEAAERGEGR